MKESILSVKVKVSDDNNHVELVDPTTSEPVSMPILLGCLRAC